MALPVFPDPEELLVAYLAQLGAASVFLPAANTDWPFYLVRRVHGADDRVTDRAVLSVHSFHPTRAGASDAARAAHRLMHELDAKTVVATPSGLAAPDRVFTVESPVWRDWGDANVQRYAARYQIELRTSAR